MIINGNVLSNVTNEDLDEYGGFVIPHNITMIANFAFGYCTSLTHVKIHYGVTDIGSYAFYGCTALINIDIPDGIKCIPERAFCNCTSLIHIRMPPSLTSIEYEAFGHCSSLTNLKISKGVKIVKPYAFYGCTLLNRIEIPDNIIFMNDSLSGLPSINSIVINAHYALTSNNDLNQYQNELMRLYDLMKTLTDKTIISFYEEPPLAQASRHSLFKSQKKEAGEGNFNVEVRNEYNHSQIEQSISDLDESRFQHFSIL